MSSVFIPTLVQSIALRNMYTKSRKDKKEGENRQDHFTLSRESEILWKDTKNEAEEDDSTHTTWLPHHMFNHFFTTFHCFFLLSLAVFLLCRSRSVMMAAELWQCGGLSERKERHREGYKN